MNSMLRATVASAAVGGAILLAGFQSARAHSVVPAASPQEQFDRATPCTARSGDVYARMAVLDARIEMLVTDVKAFAGEMSVAAMAELLTTLV